MERKIDIIKRLHALKYLHVFVSAVIFACFWFLFLRFNHTGVATRYHLFVIGLFTIFDFLFVRIYNGYKIGFERKSDLILAQVISDVLSVVIVYTSISIIWNKIYNPLMFFCSILVLTVFDITWVAYCDKIYFDNIPPRKTAIIYKNDRDIERLKEVFKADKRFEIIKKIANPIEDVISLSIDLDGIETVFVVGIDEGFRNEVIKYCVESEIESYYLPHVGDILLAGANHVQSFSVPLESVGLARTSPEYEFVKRVIDIVASLFGIIITSPIMFITAIAIKLCDRGPIFYKQIRLTRGAKEFEIIKFRSMRVDAEKNGVQLAKEDDARITPVGKLIRGCRVDELPQLFNILKGDMSIVGPRPERPELTKQYSQELPAFKFRLAVKAGLTGYAQVYGRYNTEPYDKLQFDLLYITHRSFIVDLQIIVATIAVLFKKESTEGF